MTEGIPQLGLYVAASLALILTPGQDMIYVISRSLAQGAPPGSTRRSA